MPMTQWEFRIVPCLNVSENSSHLHLGLFASENAYATCLKMLVMRFADVPLKQTCAFEFASAFCGAI